MPEGGFTARRSRISPTGLTLVILLHASAITALALSKMEVPGMKIFKPLVVKDVVEPPEPEPIPPEPVKDQKPVPRDTQIDYVKPVVPTRPQGPVVLHEPKNDVVAFDPGPIGKADEPAREVVVIPPPPPKAEPKPEPVRVKAKLRSGDLQPPYPPGEEQMGREGSVTVRLTIGADGRVKAVEKVSATSDAFFHATERHALRAWRFSPETVDGKPVESRTVMTVKFELNA
ncbi:MAG TPA: TonB family protein [Allosphingosinicella sp.]|nr:TonB family protein [Allosphingosinicella sp.]